MPIAEPYTAMGSAHHHIFWLTSVRTSIYHRALRMTIASHSIISAMVSHPPSPPHHTMNAYGSTTVSQMTLYEFIIAITIKQSTI